MVRLHITVHDAVLRRMAERGCGLDEHAPDLRDGEAPALAEPLGERLPAQELHREVDDAPRPADPVDRNDVGVLEPARGPRLALEAFHEVRIERQREGEHLQGDLPIQPALDRAEDDRHPAAPDLLDDLELGGERRPDDVEIDHLAA